VNAWTEGNETAEQGSLLMKCACDQSELYSILFMTSLIIYYLISNLSFYHLKGVHPKMKNLSVISLPHVVPTPNRTSVHLQNTNKDIFY